MVQPLPIGGEYCAERLGPELLPVDPRALTQREVAGLWALFVQIGETWKNTYHQSAGLKSSWLEFLAVKTVQRPSYVAEYLNALEVVRELIAVHRKRDAYRLFLHYVVPLDKFDVPVGLDTRLAHAKHFVVDEFIRVQIVAGGFRKFIEPTPPEQRPEYVVNYNGFLAGSRFSRILPARPFVNPVK